MRSNLSRKYILTLFSCLLFSTFVSAATMDTKKYGYDADYFLGLKNLEDGKIKEGRSKLEKAAKKGSPLVSVRSAQSLCDLGNISQRVNAAKKLLAKDTSSESLLIACRVFLEAREYSQIIQATKNLDFKKDKNELIRIRLQALQHHDKEKCQDETFRWFMECPITDEHTGFFTLPATPDSWTDKEKLMEFRILASKRKYADLFDNLSQYQSLISSEGSSFPLAISDLCKVIFYGSEDYSKQISIFSSLEKQHAGTVGEFYYLFYQGRAWDKLGGYYNRAKTAYQKAMESTTDPSLIDNALWYLWDSGLKNTPEKIMTLIQDYYTLIGNPAYYDDFFDTLCVNFLNDGRFEDLGILYQLLDGYASDETVSKYAYIYARILQEKGALGKSTSDSETRKEIIKTALKRAEKSGSDMYYRIMAADILNLSIKDKQAVWFAPRTSSPYTPNPHADILLQGYIEFGFADKIYSEYMSHDLISRDTTIAAASFLQKCSRGTDDYLVQSLRMVSRYAARTGESINMDVIKLLYPKNYYAKVTECCKKYDVSPSSMWALIRSESYFDPDVKSSAGALGLTQLMEFTAADMAKKLKLSDYDMMDPYTNIEMGCYYLGELIRRLDGDELSAFFSYNAGITRVRRWKQSANTSWKNLPGDIFLETLPYAETREYGRKLTSAKKMYTLY